MFALKIKRLHQDAVIPHYALPGDVGLDVHSLEDMSVSPGEHVRLYTGFAMEFPHGYAAIVKDKSSISKAKLHTMGGVFDAGYRGEYNIHLVNLGDTTYEIKKGDKIAQIVMLPVAVPTIEEVTELSESERGEGSFGSTGRQ